MRKDIYSLPSDVSILEQGNLVKAIMLEYVDIKTTSSSTLQKYHISSLPATHYHIWQVGVNELPDWWLIQLGRFPSVVAGFHSA